jgi:hypothetical protein
MKKEPKWKPALNKSISKEKIFDAPPETVFPFFCPVKEYEYLRNWECTMNYSKSGYAEKNAIFQSTYPWPFGLKATWVCTKYDQNVAVHYTVFIPNTLVFLVENTFEELPDNKTKHILVLTCFGLNQLGKMIAKKMVSQDEDKPGNTVTDELDYYLKNNRMMPKHAKMR